MKCCRERNKCILYVGVVGNIKIQNRKVVFQLIYLVLTSVVVVLAQRQEFKCSRRAPGYFTLIGDKAPPAARDSS